MQRISWVPGVGSSGVITIPAEILDYIFEFSVAGSFIKIHPSEKEMPWVLMFVCRQWRKMTIRNGRLWKRFFLDVDGTSLSWRLLKLLERMDVARHISSVMVNRARCFPIKIDVRWDNFLPAINEHVEELGMDLFDSSITPFLFHGPDMSGLKRLCLNFHQVNLGLNWTNIFHIIATASSPTVFQSMRNLRTLEMYSSNSFVGYALLQCQDVPWHQLLSLDIRFPKINIKMLRACLSRCGSLENLSLSFEDANTTDLPKIEILRKLKCVKYASTAARSLHVLGIPWTLLKQVQLKNLNLVSARISFIHLLGVLQDLKNVETLDLEVIYLVRGLGVQRTCYLPRLKTLNLRTLHPQILSLFKVPSLVDLTLAVPGSHTSLITPLSQMIKESLCLITVFRCHEFSVEQWIPFSPDYPTYRQEHLLRVAKFLAKYMPRVELIQGFTMTFDVKLMLKMAAGLALP
ncbi:hypothetical protein C0992_003048, partial [Termitomyces sp. T32_za158]